MRLAFITIYIKFTTIFNQIKKQHTDNVSATYCRCTNQNHKLRVPNENESVSSRRKIHSISTVLIPKVSGPLEFFLENVFSVFCQLNDQCQGKQRNDILNERYVYLFSLNMASSLTKAYSLLSTIDFL